MRSRFWLEDRRERNHLEDRAAPRWGGGLIDITMCEVLCAQRHLKRPGSKNVTQTMLKLI
jgi:hypothetical protein